LPYFEQLKYIVVGRDPRDVFMSMWNFYANFGDDFYEQINTEWPGKPFPRCPEDIHDFWQGWIGQGWFEWEREGYPFWSNMRHVQTWWDFKHLPNIRRSSFATRRSSFIVHRSSFIVHRSSFVSGLLIATNSCPLFSQQYRAT
jgi:aryl sulfotransferase